MKINKGDFVAVSIICQGVFGGVERDFKIGIVNNVLDKDDGVEVMFLPFGKECSMDGRAIETYPLDRIRPAKDVWPFMDGLTVKFSSDMEKNNG